MSDRNNAAEQKKKNVSKWCKVCGIPLDSDKERRRKLCKKHYRLERKRWRDAKKLPFRRSER
jgi:predicted nucleic acid-binding Zn ribbon protein